MWTRNQGQTEDEILQNKFTAYVLTAVQRRQYEYLDKLLKYREMMHAMEEADMEETMLHESRYMDGLPILMRIQNEALLEALLMLGKREQYVFLNYALKRKNLTELSQELGLSYKGAAAIYYRAIQKIRKRMGGKNK